LIVNDEASTPKLDDLVNRFKASFPDIRCLRCGYQSFVVFPATQQQFLVNDLARAPKLLPMVTMACARCGHIEQHLSENLGTTPIPIELAKPTEP
jgi:ribosomal protein L37E